MSKPTFKIVLLGEGRVGKTSLTLRYVNGVFNETQPSTIQATYLQKDLRVNEQPVSLAVWDTAGQEKFHALGPIYYRNADGALLVYDTTDMDTFDRVKNWIIELRKVVGNNIVLTIAGNKCDLKNRQVEESAAEEYAKSVGAHHFLTSAKANKNVEEAFLDLTKRILQKRDADRNTRPVSMKSAPIDVRDDSTPSQRSNTIRVVADDHPQAQSSSGGNCCKG